MKKMSIKWKVTLWYAGMLLLLVLLMLGIMASASDRMLRSESAKLLERRVWDFLEELEVEDGYPEWDEDLRFYEGGVMFSLYDGEGRLLAGSVPSDFPADTVLKAYAVQEFPGKEGTWTTYDAAVPFGEDEVFWIRGIYGPDPRTSLEGILMRVFLIACPLLAAVALLVGYLITRGALLPVELICRTAEEIGESGDLSRRLPEEKAQGEIRQLAETFNHMFERLEAAFERERQFTSDASHEPGGGGICASSGRSAGGAAGGASGDPAAGAEDERADLGASVSGKGGAWKRASAQGARGAVSDPSGGGGGRREKGGCPKDRGRSS